MTTDLSQFHDAFFEESFEALDDMESGLLNLNVDTFNIEAINTIFRAAHSIKGCSATFGFNDIAAYVHVMETTLDNLRDGILPLSQDLVDLLLKSLDTLRTMLTATQTGDQIDIPVVESISNDLKTFTASNLTDAKSAPIQNIISHSNPQQSSIGWQIQFHPNLEIMKTGNDPLRLFKVLSGMGEISVVADINDLLDFRSIDPEDCYLSWNINLNGEVTRQEIESVFEWIEDECEISITPISLESLDTNTPRNIPYSTQAIAPSKSTEPKHKPTLHRPDADDHETHAVGSNDSVSIRVGIDKVDAIINMVGELVITQSMLDQLGSELGDGKNDGNKFEKLRAGLIQLERNTRELQESVMRIRMLPISYVFNRVPRLVHDLSKKLKKSVNIKMTGEGTELDKTVLEKIGDPLVHLIRNAIDHGIEAPEIRRAAGKPETGTVHLNAYHKGGNIIVEIKDDGAGLNRSKIRSNAIKRGIYQDTDNIDDQNIIDLIFHPGFSTADTISDVSGRGVGMDVVRKNIKALGGNIEVDSKEGQGTSFTIRLPLTLAIVDGQLVKVGSEIYIIPLISIIESLLIDRSKINFVGGQSETYKLRDEYIPMLRMQGLLDVYGNNDLGNQNLMVVVEGDGKKAGLVVDELLGQQQVVIKSLEINYDRVDGISGATILGDGTVALIADVSGLINISSKGQIRRDHSSLNSITNFVAA